MAKRLDLTDVNIYYGSFHAVADVSLAILPRSVTAFIGPSGCGKTTVLRTLNRMHEVIPGARVEGAVLLDDQDIYAPGIDPVGVRRAIGMVFQRPNPFPAMSIRNNVVAGLKLQGVRNRKVLDDTADLLQPEPEGHRGLHLRALRLGPMPSMARLASPRVDVCSA